VEQLKPTSIGQSDRQEHRKWRPRFRIAAHHTI
jgi:hypothetical protein